MTGRIELLASGRMSTFGGPADEGVGPHDGLALIGPTDLTLWWYACLFLPEQPPDTTGLARRLNPRAYYLAMRWNYDLHPKALLRHAMVRLSSPVSGLFLFARPVDFGPGNGGEIDGRATIDTGRVADLSPGAATALGLRTDDTVTCELVS